MLRASLATLLVFVAGFVRAQDELGLPEIVSHKQRWEVGWTPDWQLKESRIDQIAHFTRGAILKWERSERGLTRVRTDAFRLDGKLAWAHEELWDGKALRWRGHVAISEKGVPVWRDGVALGDELTDPLFSRMDREILSYELELIERGQTVARYRSSLNFLAGVRGGEAVLQRVPGDTQLVWGQGPTVEQLIESVPDQSRGRRLFRETPSLRAFAERFAITDENAFRGGNSGADVDAEEILEATLSPRQSLGHASKVYVVFGLDKSGQPVVKQSPEMLRDVLYSALQTPFIQGLVSDRGCVSLMTAGDKLHRHGRHVEPARQAMTQAGWTLPELNRWARLYLDLNDAVDWRMRRYIILYHPVGTEHFVVDRGLFENPAWREQIEQLTGKPAVEFRESRYIVIADRQGQLKLLDAPAAER